MRLAIQRAVIAFDKLQTGTRSLTPRPPQPPAKTRRLWHVTATLARGTACAAIQCRIAESKVSAAAGRLRLFIGETCVGSGVPHPFTLCNAKEQPMSGCGTLSPDRKSTRLNSSHLGISYAVFCL